MSHLVAVAEITLYSAFGFTPLVDVRMCAIYERSSTVDWLKWRSYLGSWAFGLNDIVSDHQKILEFTNTSVGLRFLACIARCRLMTYRMTDVVVKCAADVDSWCAPNAPLLNLLSLMSQLFQKMALVVSDVKRELEQNNWRTYLSFWDELHSAYMTGS